MKEENEIIKLLEENLIHIEARYLNLILSYMDEMNINTLLVQKDSDGSFWCKVDDVTVKAYNERSQI